MTFEPTPFTLPGGVPLKMIEIPGLGVAFGKYPVTQAQWWAVMGGYPSRFKGDDLPVESVSWYDCREFCTRLSALTGREFRLPTSAEWETALAGQPLTLDTGWFYENSGGTAHPVGQKEPNTLGLYDMYGNVWEWCEGGDGEEECKPLRGGSWSSNHRFARSVSRFIVLPAVRNLLIGCRVVCVVRPPSALVADDRVRRFRSLAAIIEQLVACDYRCEAGPLVLNSAFIELREGARDEGCLAKNAPCGNCAWCRTFGEKL